MEWVIPVSPMDALSQARPEVFWLDRAERPDAGPSLTSSITADLVVVGAGYTGLWAALQAVEREPGRNVVVIDAGRVAEQASGRNGGFCSASLTHGLANGLERFPEELDRLQQLGDENLDEIEAAITRYGIDCDFSRPGALTVATSPSLVDALRADTDLAIAHGEKVTWLERGDVSNEIISPTYHAAAWHHDGEALVDPARLGWGLARACRELGVRIFEHTAMTGLVRAGAGVEVRTARGSIRCGAVVLGTNAFDSPVKAIRRRIAPVYDHVLMTEPMSSAQRASIGWANGQGVSDTNNLFHYSRLTDDGRVLWGGYDAVYHWKNRIDSSLEQRDATHHMLAEQFFETYPQLEGLAFSHRWGGVIDTSTRFAVGFGTALDGRVSYAVGYTGLGVGATRFGATVCLDLLDRPESELLGLDFVRTAPLPFPPEPARWIGITLTRKAMARADRTGKRGVWLKALDAVGLGFDS